MDKKASIKRTLQLLERRGVRSTKDLEKDLQKLINNDIDEFLKIFYRDFVRANFDDYNRFEILKKISRSQKARLNGYSLRRYEYRNNINLKCIFIVCKDDNNDIPVILCAFTEDWSKSKGKDSYKYNIERAITIFEKVMQGGNNENKRK